MRRGLDDPTLSHRIRGLPTVRGELVRGDRMWLYDDHPTQGKTTLLRTTQWQGKLIWV